VVIARTICTQVLSDGELNCTKIFFGKDQTTYQNIAQSSADCANNGSNQVNADVSRHSNTEGKQAQSQENQCAPLKCPLGNNGTATTEDEDIHAEVAFESGQGGEVSGVGSCFPAGEDEPSGSEEAAEAG